MNDHSPLKQVVTEKVEDSWITPIESVNALAKVYGNRLAAKEALADLLLDGEVRARARRSWFSDEEYLTLAWRDRDNVDFEEDIDLTARDWMNS